MKLSLFASRRPKFNSNFKNLIYKQNGNYL